MGTPEIGYGMRELIAPATASSTSDPFTLRQKIWPVLITADALANDEEAVLQIMCGNGVWKDVYSNGIKVVASATHMPLAIFGPGHYRVAKDETAAACGVWLHFSNANAPAEEL
jgi:hypothetical protein